MDSTHFAGEYVVINGTKKLDFGNIAGLPLESIIKPLAKKYSSRVELFPLQAQGDPLVQLNLGVYLDSNEGRYIVVLNREFYPLETSGLVSFLRTGSDNLELLKNSPIMVTLKIDPKSSAEAFSALRSMIEELELG